MNPERSIAIGVGGLFLTALFTNLFASSLLDPLITGPSYLMLAGPHASTVIGGALLNVAAAVSMILIPIVLYPVAKKHSGGLGISYLVFRLTEGLLFFIIAVKTLGLIDLSRTFRESEPELQSVVALLGDAAQSELRWWTIVYILAYAAGGLAFYTLLFRSRVVPRVFSVWGLGGVLLLLAGVILGTYRVGLFETTPLMTGMVYFAPPIALNELVLSFWLIFRGFSPPRTGLSSR